MKIGILSDTHGYFDPKLLSFFKDCSEIWHAGDIGSLEVAEKLRSIAPLMAVYGNIDGGDIRIEHPEIQHKTTAGLAILMTHIGGYPGRYNKEIFPQINQIKPAIFISGHSHILKVMPDKKRQLLHINPGAAGFHGFHHVRTAVRLSIQEEQIKDLEVIELGPRSIKTEASY